jgi:hypothetical protein
MLLTCRFLMSVRLCVYSYGGGGMDCDKALEVIRNAGVSAALFAPAW